MAKKRANTSGQRLNRELLERARQQARAIEAEEEAEDAELTSSETPVPERSVSAVRQPAPGTQRRSVSTAKRLRERNEETRKKSLTADAISQMLANPTKTVTEAELRAQYGFVLRDLRNMGILAGASFVFLIALAVVLPH
jgi:hypothetical protein